MPAVGSWRANGKAHADWCSPARTATPNPGGGKLSSLQCSQRGGACTREHAPSDPACSTPGGMTGAARRGRVAAASQIGVRREQKQPEERGRTDYTSARSSGLVRSAKRGPGGRERGEGMLREHSFDVNGSFRPLSVESKQCPRRRYRYCSRRGCLQATAGCSPDAVQPPSHRHTVTPCFKSGLAFRKNGRSP